MPTTNIPSPPASPEFEREIAELIVEALSLETSADDIVPEASLFGEGLGLDSIDILEMALVISKRYGVQLKADGENNASVFASLRTLAAYINEHRSK
jgi:acyl carrier protein